MTVQWLGHACFKLTYEGYSIVIDPYNYKYASGYPPLKVKADKVLVSHEHYGHNCREAVDLRGAKPESENPFKISSFEVWHDSVQGILRGKCLVHVFEAGGIRAAHMSDIGTALHPGQAGELRDIDILMVTAGSLTGLPAQEVGRMADELFPRVLIPMHYRHGKYTNRRLEHIDALVDCYAAPEVYKWYETDTIEVDSETEPQVAVLKYLGK